MVDHDGFNSGKMKPRVPIYLKTESVAQRRDKIWNFNVVESSKEVEETSENFDSQTSLIN